MALSFEGAVELAARAMHAGSGLGGRAGISWQGEGAEIAEIWRGHARIALIAIGWPLELGCAGCLVGFGESCSRAAPKGTDAAEPTLPDTSITAPAARTHAHAGASKVGKRA